MQETIPPAVTALAATVPQLGPLPPQPFAWHEYKSEWVIVFQDGRKLRFPKPLATPAPAAADAPRKGKGKS